MMHSILVSDIGHAGSPTVRTLATDIPGERAARSLARNLAASYAEHGSDAAGRTYWFRDRHGTHEIWTVPQRGAHELRARHGGDPGLSGPALGAFRRRPQASRAA